jgi:hypothetical protein
MLLLYIGKDEYIDSARRFQLKEGDKLAVGFEEGTELVKTGLFEEIKEEVQ